MKEIQLGGHIKNTKIRGYAIVDDEDYDLVKEYTWCLIKSPNSNYAVTSQWNKGKQKGISLHRLIMNFPKDKEVDHINGDGLDNRRENLRICSTSENQRNNKKIIRADNTSGYRGVIWREKDKKWIAQIRLEGKTIYLGLFKEKEDAALAYNKAAEKYHGKFATLNII